jgi:hypothetical protein
MDFIVYYDAPLFSGRYNVLKQSEVCNVSFHVCFVFRMFNAHGAQPLIACNTLPEKG